MQLNSKAEGGGEDGGAASRVFKRYKLPVPPYISPYLPASPCISPHLRCRYKLSDEKQFSSLFFDEKEKLLGLLTHFVAKTGKYAVARGPMQGYPHKLGLLLTLTLALALTPNLTLPLRQASTRCRATRTSSVCSCTGRPVPARPA